jgi:hypothetical protein
LPISDLRDVFSAVSDSTCTANSSVSACTKRTQISFALLSYGIIVLRCKEQFVNKRHGR